MISSSSSRKEINQAHMNDWPFKLSIIINKVRAQTSSELYGGKFVGVLTGGNMFDAELAV